MMILLPLTFIGLGFIFIVVAICSFISVGRKKKHWYKADAVITRITMGRVTVDSTPDVYVQYKDYNGLIRETKLVVYNSFMKSGQQRTVWVNPERPDKITSGSNLLGFIFLGMGIVFILVGSVFLGVSTLVELQEVGYE